MVALAYELLHTLKELQLQHGLRSDDFNRYHAHCTGRIRTLRKQLKLGSDYKKSGIKGGPPGTKAAQPIPFQAPKAVTPNNATTVNHILLMALSAERAWAESQEAAQAAAGTAAVHQQQTSATRHASDGGRKRLNKAKQLAAELAAVCSAVGDDRLKIQAAAYAETMQGRCAIAHARFDEAKTHFTAAREALLQLRTSSGTQSLWDVAVAQIVECDDRIAFAHQQLSLPTYTPAAVPQSVDGAENSEGAVVSHVTWNGRKVAVLSLRAKQMLRLVKELNADDAAQQLLDAFNVMERKHGLTAAAWGIFQLQSPYNRALDALDRTIAALNDGLDAVRHDLRDTSSGVGASSASERSRALRALQLYMQFHVHRSTVLRTVLVTANFRSRFHLSLQLLDLSGAKPTLRLALPVSLAELCPHFFGAGAAASSPTTSGKGGYRKVRREFSFGAQHIASPPEIERLCDTTIRVTDEALLLPGVEGDDSLAGPLLQAKALALVQRQLYSAEGWLVVARASEKDNKDGTEGRSAARGCVQQAVALAKAGGFPEADLYAAYSEALQASLAAQDLALNAPSSSTAAYTASSSRTVLLRTVGAANIPANATYVAELPTAFVPQSGFARVPPGFQSMPAKPAFVDIAATYLELPGDDAPTAPAPNQRAAASPPTPAAKAGSAEPSSAASAASEETKKPDEKKKGWGFGSLWGR